MVINGTTLRKHRPIEGMIREKLHQNGVSFGLGEAGYDIRIRQEIHFFGGMTPLKGYYRQIVRTDSESSEHFYGRFVIASAIEPFKMPNNLVGIVHDKSSWARRGLSVFNTVIEPGWEGFLTLELVYHGEQELRIPAGSGIAQVIFHEVSDSAKYNGRYQNQADKPVPAIRAE